MRQPLFIQEQLVFFERFDKEQSPLKLPATNENILCVATPHFFPDYVTKRGEKTIQEVSLYHLLTMTAPYKYKSELGTKVCMSEEFSGGECMLQIDCLLEI